MTFAKLRSELVALAAWSLFVTLCVVLMAAFWFAFTSLLGPL